MRLSVDLRLVLAVLLAVSLPLLAEENAADDEVSMARELAAVGDEVRFKAETVSILKEGVYEFSGNVEVTYRDVVLHADELIYDKKLNIVEAPKWAHVKYKNIDVIGEKVIYNVGTHAGQFENAHMIWDAGPFEHEGRWYERKWYIYGKKVTKDPGVNAFHIEDGRATTCPPEYQRPLYYVQAKNLSILPPNENDPNSVARIVGRNCFLKLEEIPILWLPQFTYTLREDDNQSPIQVVAGYTSQKGGFFEAYLDVFRNQYLKVTPHIGFYSEHGVSFGVDGAYSYAFSNVTTLAGAWKTFFLADKSRQFIVGSPSGKDKVKGDGKSNKSMFRYRFLWEHGQTFGPGAGWLNEGTLMWQMDLLSDSDLIHDFYREDWNAFGQRDTWIDFTKPIGPDNEVSVYVVKQINDFYTTYERLPELRHVFRKRRILEIPALNVPVFYESRTRLGYYNYLESNEQKGNTSYSVWRAWTDHKISAPKRFFGFFNFEPFLGLASTFGSVSKYDTGRINGYYSRNQLWTYQVRRPPIFSLFDYNRFSRVPINVFTEQDENGFFYMLPYGGVDLSIKSHRTYDLEGTYAGQLMRRYLASDNEKVRHIFEPMGRLITALGAGTDSGAVLGWDEGFRTALQIQRNGRNADLVDMTFFHSIRMRGGGLFNDQDIVRRYRYIPARGAYLEYDREYTYTPKHAFGFSANANPLDWLGGSGDLVFDMDKYNAIQQADVRTHADLSWALQRMFASPHMLRSLRGRKDEMIVNFGYRYVYDQANVISAGGRVWFDDFTPLLSPEYQQKTWAREWTRGWGVGAGLRYDMRYGSLQEMEYSLYKNWKKCLDTGVTYRYRDGNDHAILASFWLTAYPQLKVGTQQ